MAHGSLGTSARSLLGTDWPALRWVVPGRIAIAAAAAVAIALVVSDVADAIPLSLGILFTGIGDPRGVFALRVRGMALAAVGMAVATELALFVAGHAALHLVVVAAVAFVCGFVGLGGPRAALAGMVSLVMFAIYAGAPEPLGQELRTGVLVLLGGMITMLVVLLPLFLRRMGGVRTDVAIAYRALGFAVRDDPHWQRAAGPAAKLAVARDRVAEAQPREATGTWYATLLDGAERIRIAALALQAERHGDAAEPIGRLVPAIAAFALAAGAAIELEPRRGRMVPAAEGLRSALSVARDELPARVHSALDIIAVEAEQVAAALATPFPVGRAARFDLAAIPARVGLRTLLRRDDAGRMFLRHGIRLATVMVVATAVTYVWSMPHDYWFPMTVAWVMKPDYAATMPRLLARTSGVILGAAGTVLVLSITGGGPGALIIGAGVAGLLFVAFVVPNYTIATLGITAFVVTILYAKSDPLLDTVPAQIACAVAAAAAAALSTWVWPTRTTARIADELAGFARSLGAYARTLHGPSGADAGERLAARRANAAARTRASAIIAAAHHEPGGHRVRSDAAAIMLRDLDDATAIAVAVELGIHDEHPDGVDERAVAELEALAERLDAVHATGQCAPAIRWDADTRFGRLAADASAALDVAAT